MDLIMGRFAEAALPGYGPKELALYEELLHENDPDLYDWIVGRSAAPPHVQHEVMQALIAFHMYDKNKAAE